MAEIVFNDAVALETLNNIVHPKVAACFEKWVAKNSNAPMVVKEAAILIESKAYQHVDKIILVTAPESIRISRVVGRDNVSEEKVKSRMKAQLSDKEKLAYADFIIVNDAIELVVPQVLKIHQESISFPET
jgi:dephospho-CoA kinase